ncbi:hypothetical protein BN903_46 [Halorubrum sp. AJ67]|nr:hypothetical protein BN903_46 [Halorubrum sp. AJ67]
MELEARTVDVDERTPAKNRALLIRGRLGDQWWWNCSEKSIRNLRYIR